jgi:hypothetical protein
MFVGPYTDNRQPQDGAEIVKMAKKFLYNNELEFLSSMLAVPVSQLKFDVAEAQILRSRVPVEQLLVTFPRVLHLYEFILTLDGILVQIRSLSAQVKSLDDIGAGTTELAAALKTQIMSSDFRPWAAVEGDTGLKSPEEIAGESVASKTVVGWKKDAGDAREAGEVKEADPEDAKFAAFAEGLARGVVRAFRAPMVNKNDARLAADEQVLLKFPIISSLVALSQGVYRLVIEDYPEMRWWNGNASVNVDGRYRGTGGVGGAVPSFSGRGSIGAKDITDNLDAAYMVVVDSERVKMDSKALSKAYKSSGLMNYADQMYHELQKEFTNKLVRSGVGMMNTAYDFTVNANRGRNFGKTLKCPEGMVRDYRDSMGRPVPRHLAEAANGMVSHLVNIDRSSCVPSVPIGAYGALTIPQGPAGVNAVTAAGMKPAFDWRAMMLKPGQMSAKKRSRSRSASKKPSKKKKASTKRSKSRSKPASKKHKSRSKSRSHSKKPHKKSRGSKKHRKSMKAMLLKPESAVKSASFQAKKKKRHHKKRSASPRRHRRA